jgi:hypothetical protein
LQIAFERANEGQFFVTPNSNYQVLDELVRDGVLGYETAGYFITHDIYEEWALEKIIKSEFIKKSSNKELFIILGESLPIRRCFRNWISEQLLLGDSHIKQFIEEIIEDNEIASFWKDEVLVSVLLSDYAETFFDMFKEKLFENELILMKKITFLLRITCKEVDSDFFNQLGIKDINMLSIEYFLTKPKGEGWISFIKFVYENLDVIGISNIHFILPIINDWTSKFKNGETTKKASLIALKYYQWTIQEDIYFSRDEEVKEKLFQTILYGASEIKEELISIFEEILTNKWKRHRDPYYELVKVILTKLGENIEVIKALPGHILKLAELFWFKTPRKEDFYYSSGIGVEEYFCLEKNHLDFYPSSSFQTPIYWLLQFNLKETIDFILDFTNKTVECFAKSDLARNEIEEIDVFIEDGNYMKQYICNRLWNTYRGTQVSPHVLEAMHMALEKFFLERIKNSESKVLETWLFYLLRNTRSASISAIVVSVVLACPEKTFNIAKVLFQTKEFFLYDTSRMLLDRSAKMDFYIGYGLDYRNKIHQDERIKSCDDEHRKKCLEHLVLSYQLFRSEEVSAEEAKKRQEIIWNILDKYYDELPDKSKETQADKTWRLYLARMDRRKMKPTIEEKDGQILISFNPEIERELKEFSENSLKQNSELMKHSPLHLWADYKMRNDEQYKNYMQYEDNPSLVLKEVKEIVEELKNPKDANYFFFNKSILGQTCSVLIRDYFNKLSKEEKVFCKDIIIEVASSSLRDNYSYQIADGVESAVFVLPKLLKEFPEDKETIKSILLMILFDDHNIGMYCEFSDYSKKAIINNLWDISYYDAQSLLYGYLLLKPIYEESRLVIRKENHKKNIYDINESDIVRDFLKKNEECLQKVINNKITINDLKHIEKLELYILKNAFELIPQKTDEPDHKNLVKLIISVFSKALLTVKRDDKVDYNVRHGFLEKLSYFILNASEKDIKDYLRPFTEGFNSSEVFADLFKEFIIAEDKLEAYNEFWYIWHLFYKKLVDLCKDGDKHWYKDEIIKSYLFAKSPWREEVREWHMLKLSNKMFFKKVTEEMGHCPSVLYAISRLLSNIGSVYLNDGILWISKMLNNNKNLWTDKLETDTTYYLENIVKKYIYVNREAIRKTKQLKQQVIVILDFLIEKGSVVGYMLRDNIL